MNEKKYVFVNIAVATLCAVCILVSKLLIHDGFSLLFAMVSCGVFMHQTMTGLLKLGITLKIFD